MIKWKSTKFELGLISKIADRAVIMAKDEDISYPKMEIMMDIEACISNGNPLRLDELLTTDDANFGHDIFGIRRHMNRETGALMNCFSPRFSLRN